MGDSARSDLACRVGDCAHICAQLIHANRSLPALNRHVSHQLKIKLGFGPWALPQQPVTSKTAQTLLLSHSGNQQVALAPSIKDSQGRQRIAFTSLCNWRASGSFGWASTSRSVSSRARGSEPESRWIVINATKVSRSLG